MTQAEAVPKPLKHYGYKAWQGYCSDRSRGPQRGCFSQVQVSTRSVQKGYERKLPGKARQLVW